jgi:lactoylglutathione lyase
MLAARLSNIVMRTASRAFLSTTSTTRPFQILGVQQIAIGCEEKGPLNALWKDVFGLTASANKVLEKENVDEDIVKLGPPGYEVEIDLMTPLDANKSPKVG